MTDVSIYGTDFGSQEPITRLLASVFSYSGSGSSGDSFVYSFQDTSLDRRYIYNVSTLDSPTNTLNSLTAYQLSVTINTISTNLYLGSILYTDVDFSMNVVGTNYTLRQNDNFIVSANISCVYGDADGSLDYYYTNGNDSFYISSTTTISTTPDGQYGVFGDTIRFLNTVSVVFGNDSINAGATTSAMRLIGDTSTASEFAIYGADTITGGSAGDTIFGDCTEQPAGFTNGGNDRLFGGGGGDEIFAGGGNDWVDGGTGADILWGGYGDDTYVVDDAGDSIQEIPNFNGGNDTVRSSITMTLGYFVENLTLTGTAAINGIGSRLNNVLVGNSGNNILNGVAGADSMAGGDGNDTYYVDNMLDVVLENAANGSDTVFASVSYELDDNIESLRLQGSASTATGNDLANLIMGTALANTLYGMGGGDTLYGYEGNDLLNGGAGQDRFCFNTALGATNVDSIVDFVALDDTILLGLGIFNNAGPAGMLASTAFKETGFSGAPNVDSDDRIIHNRGTGEIFYDADGSGAASAAILFAKVGNGLVMTNADFTLF